MQDASVSQPSQAQRAAPSLSPPEWRVVQDGSVTCLRLTGDWIACENGIRKPAEIRGIIDAAGGGVLRLDASLLRRWDSALVAFIAMLREAAGTGWTPPIQIDETGLPEAARRLLALAAAATPHPAAPPLEHPVSLPTRVGEASFAAWSSTVAAIDLVGQTALRCAAAIAGHTRMRAIDVLQLMGESGAGALGIVAVVNGLVGAILAFVGALELRRFGAGIYSADLVGIAVVREMGALVTAIVMAGRTGGAYAAQLATMQGNEEIDALNALGIPVFDFLVLPRIAALVTMVPLLYLYGCAVGLLGGMAVSLATLDIGATGFLQELREALDATEFAIGFSKSIVFGVLIALAGCHIGLRAGRSAADVGRAATAAVVAGIVGTIALDAIFALCTNALGI